MCGVATGKARLPVVESLTEATARRLVPAERSVCLPCRLAAGTSVPRFALPCNTGQLTNTGLPRKWCMCVFADVFDQVNGHSSV